jgi:hypothetical protein
MTNARRQQLHKETARREVIAEIVRERMDRLTPHLDGTCPVCRRDNGGLTVEFKQGHFPL